MSSSPSVCESLQSCLEFQPRDLVPSSKSFFSFHNKPQNSLSHGEEPYLHPLLSKPFLSSKSLEMCTESLGSETGSGIDQCSHLSAAAAAAEENCSARKQKKQTKKTKHGGGGGSFPPPLSSIGGSGSGGVQVHTHREGGHLVIKAFASSARGSLFQAERSNGRLRLSLLKDGGGGDEEEEVGGEEGGFGGRFWGENVKEEGGKVRANSSGRCNEERSSRKKRLQQSLQFCVVGV